MFELILRNGEPGSERGVTAGVRYILMADHLTFEGEGMGDFRKNILETDFMEKIILARKYLAGKISALKRNIFHGL